MVRLSQADERCVDAIASLLRSVDDGGPGALAAAVPLLAPAFDSAHGVGYALRREGDALALAEAHLTGPGAAAYLADFDRALRATPVNFLTYNASCPEPPLRNAVSVVDPADVRRRAESAPALAELAGRHEILAREHELRLLVCDGPSLLAWVGATRPEPYGARERAMLARLAPAFRDRLVLERQVAFAPVASVAFAAALEQVGAPAFLLRQDGTVVQTNSAGRELYDAERGALDAALRSTVATGAHDEYLVSRFAAPGLPTHFLVVRRRCPEDPASRAALLAAQWELTARQQEVLALLARGHANKTIATFLGCAESTVELHVTALLDRAQCESRSALVARFWTV